MPRTVDVRVVSARHLPDVDTFGAVDAYCVLLHGENEVSRTETIESREPRWDSKALRVTDATSGPLELRLFDANVTRGDTALGSAALLPANWDDAAGTMRRGEWQERWVELKQEGQAFEPQVFVQLMAVDFGLEETADPDVETKEAEEEPNAEMSSSKTHADTQRQRQPTATANEDVIQVEVEVLAVHEMPSTDTFSAADAYVALSWGPHRVRTETVHDNPRPRWSTGAACFSLASENAEHKGDPLTVEVWDEDVGSDTVLAVGRIDLSTVSPPESWCRLQVPCTDPEGRGYTPEVELRLKVTGFAPRHTEAEAEDNKPAVEKSATPKKRGSTATNKPASKEAVVDDGPQQKKKPRTAAPPSGAKYVVEVHLQSVEGDLGDEPHTVQLTYGRHISKAPTPRVTSRTAEDEPAGEEDGQEEEEKGAPSTLVTLLWEEEGTSALVLRTNTSPPVFDASLAVVRCRDGRSAGSLKLQPLVRSLVRDEPAAFQSRCFGPGTDGPVVAFTLTARGFGAAASNASKRNVPVVYDEAFRQACENCGVTEDDLTLKPRESFDGSPRQPSRSPRRPSSSTQQQPSKVVQDGIAQMRYEAHQAVLIRTLHRVTVERQRLLDEAARRNAVRARHEAREEQVGRTSRRHTEEGEEEGDTPVVEDDAEEDPELQRAALIERAKRQRRQADKFRERRDKALTVRRTRWDELERRAAEEAERLRMEREKSFVQLRALHRANQAQTRKRVVRDEELAEARQQLVLAEDAKRRERAADKAAELQRARERRKEFLTIVAGESSEGNTKARLERAQQLRAEREAAAAERARAALARVDERVEQHVCDQFLHQVDLANKALAERKSLEDHLERSRRAEEARVESVTARLAMSTKRSHDVLHDQNTGRAAMVHHKAKTREEHHATAREHRMAKAKEDADRREASAEAAARRRKEREEARALEQARQQEGAIVRTAHQEQVLRRVNAQAEQQQRAMDARSVARQSAADRRLMRLAEIRSAGLL